MADDLDSLLGTSIERQGQKPAGRSEGFPESPRPPVAEGAPKKLSAAAFALALICFVLPFVTFSCQGQKVFTLSGIQMVTGTTFQQPQMLGPPKQEKIEAEPLATLAFMAALAGLVVSFLRGKFGAIPAAASGGLGVVFLMALQSKLDGDTLQRGQGVLQINSEYGFYMAVVLFAAALLINGYILVQGTVVSPSAPRGSPGSRFCPQCGARNAASDLFCKECGVKFK